MNTEQTPWKVPAIAAAGLLLLQALLLSIKVVVFQYTEETLFSRSMVNMIVMAVLLTILLLFFRRKKERLWVFPKTFGLPYLLMTIFALLFYAVTLFWVSPFSVRGLLMLLYGSIVTPVFEELLFRGALWNQLNRCFARERTTFLTVTLLFALWHIGYAVGLYLWTGGDLLRGIVMKVGIGALFGIITGVLRWKTKNCYLGILVHGILNAVS